MMRFIARVCGLVAEGDALEEHEGSRVGPPRLPLASERLEIDEVVVYALAVPAGGELAAVLAPEDMIEVGPRAALDQLRGERILGEASTAPPSSVRRQRCERRCDARIGKGVPHLDEQVGGDPL